MKIYSKVHTAKFCTCKNFPLYYTVGLGGSFPNDESENKTSGSGNKTPGSGNMTQVPEFGNMTPGSGNMTLESGNET